MVSHRIIIPKTAIPTEMGSRTIILKMETEYRVEIENTPLRVVLIKGQAEVFGRELVINQPLHFSNCKIAIFTWFGAEIQVSMICDIFQIFGGGVPNEYEGIETPMISYINVSHLINEQRREALLNKKIGPRV